MAHSAAEDKELDRFEQLWQAGRPARIEDCLRACPAARPAFVAELVKIDLDYRWRRPGSADERPRLEDYLRRFATLAQIGPGLLELIAEEYRLRCCAGERPGHAEYAARFAGCGAALPQRLARVDAELAREPPPLRRTQSAGPRKGAPLDDPTKPQSVTLPELLDALRRFQLVSAAQLDEVTLKRGPSGLEPHALTKELLQRGWLTPFQANLLLRGRAAELLLPPYILLERLGEGGMGQVFKARHADMRRVVALKLLRKELLTDPEVVGRFRREVEILSQLRHPHVIQAYDANLGEPTPYLVTEFVEGVTLSRLVQDKGVLSVPQACSLIAQSALGLQHLHEHGLVHRDIKPGNLMITAAAHAGQQEWGTVKLMDLGLARLTNPVPGGNDAATATGTLLVGTIDYMAPEQALDFHRADIRADIYSLGGTLYYLLTGQTPFGAGTVAQKLLHHQMKEPAPLRQFRADVPAALADLLARMMAKQPDKRFQTPAEVVAVLAPLTQSARAIPLPGNRPAASAEPPGAHLPVAGTAGPVDVPPLAHNPLDPPRRSWRPTRRQALLLLSLAAALMLAWLASLLLSGRSGPPSAFLADLPEANPKGLYWGKGKMKHGEQEVVPTVVGIPYFKALVMWPERTTRTASVRYRLDGRFRHLRGSVGVDRRTVPPNGAYLRGSVLADGKPLWTSRPFAELNSPPEKFDLEIAGVQMLELTVTLTASTTESGCLIWMDPQVSK